MRVLALIAGLLLAVAGITVATEAGSKTDTGMCRVVCTPEPGAKSVNHARARPVAVRHRESHHARHHASHHAHHYARHDFYSYREAEAVGSNRDEWHGRWRAAPDDAMIPGPPPAGYYPPPGYPAGAPYCNCGEGLHVDQGGWTGGVGYAAAQEGGFMDGYGVMHFGGGNNGPTYNSYGQSFQYNPSMPRPFAPRGGFAPGRGMGGFGPHR